MAITNAGEWVAFHADDVVIDTEITHMFFLVSGRMQVALYEFLGKEIQKDTFARGAILGLFSLGLSERSRMQVVAIEPARAIRLTLSELLQLTAKHPDFLLAMFRAAASLYKRPSPSIAPFPSHPSWVSSITPRLRVQSPLG